LIVYVLVVYDEPDVEDLFRQRFRRDLKSKRFTISFLHPRPMRWSALPRSGTPR
jgi:hypothetical protein